MVILYAAIKVEDDTVTLKSVGDLLQLADLERLGTVINEALSESMPEIEENMGEQKATPILLHGIGSGFIIWVQIYQV